MNTIVGAQFYCGRLAFKVPLLADWPSYQAVHMENHCQIFDKYTTQGRKLELEREIVAKKRRYMEYLHANLASEFWGGAPRQEHGMQRLLRGIQQIIENIKFQLDQLAMLDVGTAQYEGPDRCHAADLAVLLGCSAVKLHALEPLEAELAKTRRAAQQQLRRQLRLGPRKAAGCITWHQLAASNRTGMLQMRGRANQASLSMAIPEVTRSPDYKNTPVIHVPAKKLDEFAKDLGLGPIILLKIDTEGHDMEVLQGSRSLLERGCIAAVVFEVAGQMNSDFFRIHKEFGQPRPDIASDVGPQIAEPNLHSMVRWFEGLRYESFLLGSRSLIPLASSWWHSSYEVCITRPELPCWYDVLAILQHSSVATCFGNSLEAIRQDLFQAFDEVSE